MIRVFVYGTLLTGESNHHVAAPYISDVQHGAVVGSLHDVGPYPALVIGGEAVRIEGEWLTVSPEGLAAMDVLEDYRGPGDTNEYERVWVQDAEDRTKEGWVYVYPHSRGLPLIPGGSWREHLKRRRSEASSS